MEQQNKTVNLAVVEDDDKTRERFCATIDEYGKRHGINFCKRCFGLATDFLENYSPDYDIIFMDIQLPDLDGMSAAKKLREVDKSVTLVFVTNFAQYAINGYEVGATDFMNALEEFNNGMRGTLADFEIIALCETPIVEVYPIQLT